MIEKDGTVTVYIPTICCPEGYAVFGVNASYRGAQDALFENGFTFGSEWDNRGAIYRDKEGTEAFIDERKLNS